MFSIYTSTDSYVPISRYEPSIGSSKSKFALLESWLSSLNNSNCDDSSTEEGMLYIDDFLLSILRRFMAISRKGKACYKTVLDFFLSNSALLEGPLIWLFLWDITLSLESFISRVNDVYYLWPVWDTSISITSSLDAIPKLLS